MLIFNELLESAGIASLQASTKIAEVTSVIIDPNELVIVGFLVETRRSKEPLVLHAEDIKAAKQKMMMIDHDEQLMELDDLVKIQELVDLDFQLIDKPVVTEGGKKLGRVGRYTIDSDSWEIQKIHVNAPLTRTLTKSDHIIHRSQVVKVSNKKVTVASTKIAVKEQKKEVVFDFGKARLESAQKDLD